MSDYTFIKGRDQTYTVGHYCPHWVPLVDAASQAEALAWINYLNGGKGTYVNETWEGLGRIDAVVCKQVIQVNHDKP